MTDHELSPAQLEAATHQRKTMDAFVAAVEASGDAECVIDGRTTIREWLARWRDWWTLDVDAYREDHPQPTPTPRDILSEASVAAQEHDYDWELQAPGHGGDPYSLRIWPGVLGVTKATEEVTS